VGASYLFAARNGRNDKTGWRDRLGFVLRFAELPIRLQLWVVPSRHLTLVNRSL
jgi:hypothetical protein